MNKIQEALTRRVVEIIDRSHLEKRLGNGEKLRIKHGIDPTGPKIHLGRTIPLLKLREFQELGHQIILILGTFTARIGDASDKDSMRPMLSEEQIKENVKDYRQQIGKILDLSKTEIRENSEWLEKLNPYEFIRLTSKFTYAQIVERDLFQRRIAEKKDLGLHEFLYPLMQGYDSVAIRADLEIGGTDQKFNLLMGRNVQKYYGQEPQDIMTLEMLLGTDGRKMSTSWGNVVNILDSPQEMFGRIMSMKDELITSYFRLCTRIPLSRVKEYEKSLQDKLNPMEIKEKLAFEIVKMYYSEKEATKAQEEFERVFQKKEPPQTAPEAEVERGQVTAEELLLKIGLAKSMSEAKRLIAQKGVDINGITIVDHKALITPEKGMVIKVGKTKFIRLKIKN